MPLLVGPTSCRRRPLQAHAVHGGVFLDPVILPLQRGLRIDGFTGSGWVVETRCVCGLGGSKAGHRQTRALRRPLFAARRDRIPLHIVQSLHRYMSRVLFVGRACISRAGSARAAVRALAVGGQTQQRAGGLFGTQINPNPAGGEGEK